MNRAVLALALALALAEVVVATVTRWTGETKALVVTRREQRTKTTFILMSCMCVSTIDLERETRYKLYNILSSFDVRQQDAARATGNACKREREREMTRTATWSEVLGVPRQKSTDVEGSA
jgi:hypothetical protein